MTKKLPFRTTALACVLLLGMTTMAQVGFQPMPASDVYCPSGKMNTNVTFSTISSMQQNKMTLIENAKKTSINDEGGFNVTATLEYDPNQFQAPETISLYDAATGNSYNLQDWNGTGEYTLLPIPGVMFVAAGTYDIFAQFKKGRTPYFVIIEQYEITSDVTLTINPDVCTNSLTVKNYGPNGELLKHGLGHYDNEGQFVLDEEGEIERTNLRFDIYLNGVLLLGAAAQYVGPMLDEESCACPHEIFVTDVSDRFVFIQKRIDVTKDYSRSYCCWFSTKDVKEGFENDPNEYVQQIYNYKYTPYGSQQDGCGLLLMLGEILNDNSNWSFTFFTLHSPEAKSGDIFTHELWANIPFTDPNIPDCNILLQPIFDDYAINMYGAVSYPGMCSGPVLRVNEGQKIFTNIGHPSANNWGMISYIDPLYYRLNPDGIGIWNYLPTPESFTYPADQASGIFNNNSPINSVVVQNYDYVKPNEFVYPDAPDGNTQFTISDHFVGRYGEQRIGGDEGITRTVKLNGEEVGMQGAYYSVTDGTAICEYTVTNTNIDVDGLPGHNSTTVYFDQNQEDKTPPSLEMLHFKNSDGNVTDRFTIASDGTIEFYASDFDYHYYQDPMWGLAGEFECLPVEVLVEYAPYGTEDWNELVVEEIPELYQAPGWGYFYRGSLADVIGQAEQGWFDLKFRLVDASGNWQEQIVSPAFRIDDLAYTSVATVGSGTAHEVARYTLDGRRADANTKGVVIVKMSDGTARKVLN